MLLTYLPFIPQARALSASYFILIKLYTSHTLFLNIAVMDKIDNAIEAISNLDIYFDLIMTLIAHTHFYIYPAHTRCE